MAEDNKNDKTQSSKLDVTKFLVGADILALKIAQEWQSEKTVIALLEELRCESGTRLY